MDDKVIKILTNLGINKHQAKIYLACLELGEATVLEIAKKAGLKRTSLYFILEHLKTQGLVYQTKRGKKTFYLAEEPERLMNQYKSSVEQFGRQLETLKHLSGQRRWRSRTYFFTGSEGFKKIWQIIFKSKIDEYLIITEPQTMLGFVRQRYISQRIIQEKKRLNIKSRQLVAYSEYAKEILAKDRRENRQSKILPPNHKIYFTIIIFGNHVALISHQLENLMVVIESDDLAKTQRSIFEIIWQSLPEIKPYWQR